jgi:hypothetical protein
MPLDVNNPWEAVAYFTLGFHCEDCKVFIEFDSSHKPCSNDWCIQLAKTAFERGWFIKHPDKNGSMDVGTAWCPQCGLKRGLTQPAFETFVKQKQSA